MKKIMYLCICILSCHNAIGQKLLFSYDDISHKPNDTTVYNIAARGFLGYNGKIKLFKKKGHNVFYRPDSTLWGYMNRNGYVYRYLNRHPRTSGYHGEIRQLLENGPVYLYCKQYAPYHGKPSAISFSKTPYSDILPFFPDSFYPEYADNPCLVEKVRKVHFNFKRKRTVNDIYRECEKGL